MWIAQQTHPLIDIISDCLTVWACLYLLAFGKNDEANIHGTSASHSRTEADRAATKYAPEKCEQHIQYINMCGYRWWAEDVQCQSCVRFSRKCAKCKQETVSMAVTEQDLLSALCALSLSLFFCLFLWRRFECCSVKCCPQVLSLKRLC